VIVAFDSDVDTNDNVKYARTQLTTELTRRGAVVLYLSWEGEKGIDDHLAAVGPDPVLVDIENAPPADDWEAKLLRTKNGYKGILANVITAFRFAPEWAGSLRFDSFRQRVITTKPTPASATPVESWTDQHSRLATDWIQHKSINVDSWRHVYDGVLTVSVMSSFHSLRDRLDALEWDKTERLNNILPTYAGAEPTPYVRMIGPMWLKMMTARAYMPGCMAQYVPVLEGPQGRQKSQFLKELMLEPWWYATGTPPDAEDKDSAAKLDGIVAYEIAEIDSLGSRDQARVKGFITTDEDRYRVPYGVATESHPRCAVMVGTTNKSDWMTDPTGNRRYWPVPVGKIDIDRLKADRQQLWAEAVYRYKAGERYWPTKEEEAKYFEVEQDDRFSEHAWTAPVLRWCNDPTTGPETKSESEEDTSPPLDSSPGQVLLHEVLLYAARVPLGFQNRGHEMVVSGILKRAGWKRKRLGADRAWFYVNEDVNPVPVPVPARGHQEEIPF